MATTWEAHVAEWQVAEQQAIEQGTCFCLCGCQQPAGTVALFSTPTPGICGDCVKARSTKRGAQQHQRMYRAADSWVDPEVDDEPERPSGMLARLFRRDGTHPGLQEATEYARTYGTEGTRLMVAMHEKVQAGKELTAAQVDAVLASKAADTKSARAAFRRVQAESKRKGNAVDLSRVYIGDAVRDADYAVVGDAGDIVILRVRRPKTGTLHGFVVVEAVVGAGVTRWGVQYPQPYRECNGYRQTYRGYMPHLVDQLVKDPLAARTRHEQLLGRPA
jgi:hypothetical protein